MREERCWIKLGAALTFCFAVDEVAALNNPAAVLYAPNDMRFEDHALPESIAPGHVRVKVKALGICGSDVHFFKKVTISASSPLSRALQFSY